LIFGKLTDRNKSVPFYGSQCITSELYNQFCEVCVSIMTLLYPSMFAPLTAGQAALRTCGLTDCDLDW